MQLSLYRCPWTQSFGSLSVWLQHCSYRREYSNKI